MEESRMKVRCDYADNCYSERCVDKKPHEYRLDCNEVCPSHPEAKCKEAKIVKAHDSVMPLKGTIQIVYEAIAQAQLSKCTEELNQWVSVPDSEGWWWFKWDVNKTIQPRWVSELTKGFYTESYEETDEPDYYHCNMRPVTSYKGKWCKAYMPEEK
jgi:hypothetical protein